MIDDRVKLEDFKGVGEKLSGKIIRELGGEENLYEIVDNLELEKLTSIEGISQKKAIEIMNQLLGNPKQEFFKSDRAVEIYDDIIQKILAYSNTEYS